MIQRVILALALFGAILPSAFGQYQGWQHSGSLYVLTTPEGADLSAAASEEGFPLLVHLDKEFFDFSQTNPGGEDIRFATATGAPLAYQIDAWDAIAGTASIWIRIPAIKGNARQEIKMFWGRADAKSESNGPGVFNGSNGYLSVWHMNDPVKDEVGVVPSNDTGTTPSAGIVGKSRRFSVGKGIDCGEKITAYPSGSSPHSSEAWFRAETSNATVLAWGNEQAQGKVVMELASPPHMRMDCYFSGGNVEGESTLPLSQWLHVIHTYKNGESRIYVNGVLDGVNTSAGGPLAIKSPARMYIGGWYNNFRFDGDIDEVRISKVTRSADWVRLQYENQKLMQTLVGPVVQPGQEFSVSQKKISLLENQTISLSAKAGGAQKIYWIVKRGGKESIASVDRFHFTFDAGRVAEDESLTIRFKAIYPTEVKTQDIPVAIKKVIPDPAFTLRAPVAWDGREAIEATSQIANWDAMKAAGAAELKYIWSVSGMAVIKEIQPGKLVLKRSQNSGTLTVRLAVSNGGAATVHETKILVKEPAKDAWVERTASKDEKPVDNQFYARDDKNEGALFYNGKLDTAADSVFLKVYADSKLFATETQKLMADRRYAFTVKLKPGLIKYKVQFGSKSGNAETVLHTVNNLVCGDAYLIDGQSNALATDWGPGEHTDTSEWIRSFGDNSGDIGSGWGNAVRRQGGHWQIGCWGMDLARQLVENQKIPICIINGAVGGTLIEAHQRNSAEPTDPQTIYGRLLNRIEKAGLTHGIRGAFWHQGENNQGAQGASGGYGWETYEQYFVEMTAGWKEDYPNIRHYYIFQIWPNSCSMGGNKHSDKLRDVQRLLPRLYSNMSIMSTLGIKPEGYCHFPPAGYAELAKLIGAVVERDNYGKAFKKPITPPDVKKAYFVSGKSDEIALEFDQPMAWSDALVSQFYLDGKEGQIASGSAAGNVVTLKLASDTDARTITYLVDKKWDPKNLLCGQNGIAALTFFEVEISRTTAKP